MTQILTAKLRNHDDTTTTELQRRIGEFTDGTVEKGEFRDKGWMMSTRTHRLYGGFVRPPDPSVYIRTCEICGSRFQFGNHRYEGKVIRQYQLFVCLSCYTGNWDGWGPLFEETLIQHLTAKGVPIPERNEKGWIPRGE